MECKFKQIAKIRCSNDVLVLKSQTVVNSAINFLLDNVADYISDKTAVQKSKAFLNNKIINFQVDSVRQIYQDRPNTPTIMRQQTLPNKTPGQCFLPMSAQIRGKSGKDARCSMTNTSKKTIQGHYSQFRQNRNMTSTTSLLADRKSRTTSKKNTNQKRFFAVKSTYDEELNTSFIEQLRMKKVQEENQMKKKKQFLESIQFDSNAYSSAQAKFIQSVSRKKYIYGNNGQVIQINGKSAINHLKKISVISKSRTQVKQKTIAQLKKFQDQLKQNINIQFKGRNSPAIQQTNPSQTLHTQLRNKTQPVQHTAPNRQSPSSKRMLNDQGSKEHQNQPLVSRGKQIQIKKKNQKILFYNSPNSVYRVINDYRIKEKLQTRNQDE